MLVRTVFANIPAYGFCCSPKENLFFRAQSRKKPSALLTLFNILIHTLVDEKSIPFPIGYDELPMTTPPRNTRLLIFAKAPVPGTVKTRLIPALGARRAAALQGALIHHILTIATRTDLAVELWCHPHHEHPLFSIYAQEFPVVFRTQEGADLGARMYHAAREALAAGPVILIGSDCPTLTAEELREASMMLEGGCDAVLGPAVDGGYYLLGLNRIDPWLFEGISWGSDRVLEETRRHLRALGWRWREMFVKRDMDRPADLAFLPAALKTVIDGFS
uniref:Glycosyltransferase n=1 Tax=Candidatus Kentrum sp. FW TaxID=2126338 RepID=A0A450TQG2_9GAMM|nr:MAG: hypothetical protein BECKFW1821B_GA0114236_11832 [Candidatus Kentron sp. FW]